VSYWFKQEKLAFVGDTLFSVGCGRILEGNPEMMWNSLLKIRNLPPDTQLFCGHEYTAANVHFALTIEQNNAALRARAEEVVRLIEQKKPTIPTTVMQEKSYNPFLRADLHSVAASVGLEGAAPVQVFATVRGRKDKF
jgi:hydroxyacylglutathione hydrolase